MISFAPSDPEGTKAPTAISSIGTPSSIVLGPDGYFWVAAGEFLTRFLPAVPSASKPFKGLAGDPRDIDVAGSLLVIADFSGNRIVTATVADPPVTADHKLFGGSQGVAGAPSGQIAFSQQGGAPNQIGLLTPPGAPLLTDLPEADPFGATFGPDGAFWLALANKAALARLTTGNQSSQLSGFAPGAKPRQIAPGPGNTLWVTLPSEGASKVARVSGVDTPASVIPILTPSKEPRTRIDRAPGAKVKTTKKRARVRFRFSSPDAGSTFECRVRRLARKIAKASKVPKFSACKSPKRYLLRPGFEVRAVLAGLRDATPAKRGFRIVRVQQK